MELCLKRPLVFLDLETTGINVTTDRIVEITLLRIEPNGKETEKTFLINPQIPISKEATEVHGITDEMVSGKPPFREVAKNIAAFIEGADLAGFNSNKFDIPLLAEEFLRANVDFNMKNRKFVDVQVIYHKMEQRTLSAAYKFYCHKELEDAHSSKADTRATLEVLKAQFDYYSDLPRNINELSEFSSQNRNVDLIGHIVLNDNNVEVFNFGKYKGIPVEEVLTRDPGYFGWIMNGQFPLYTKKTLTELKLRYAKI